MNYCKKIDIENELVYDITDTELFDNLYGEHIQEGALYSLYAFINSQKEVSLKVAIGSSVEYNHSDIIDEIRLSENEKKEILENIILFLTPKVFENDFMSIYNAI